MTEILFDKNFLIRLREDLKTAKEVIVITPTIRSAFQKVFLPVLQGGASVHLITNHPNVIRWMYTKQNEFILEARKSGFEVSCVRGHYLLHQKIILIPPDIAYIGSHNITGAGIYSNFECSVKIQDLGAYQTILERIEKLITKREQKSI